MNRIVALFSLSLLLTACADHHIDPAETRALYGDWATGETIKYVEIDYTSTPIYKKIKHHPEEFSHLDDVTIYRMGHLSDSLLLTGFIVAPKKPGKYPCVVYNRGGNQELGSLIVANAVEIMAPIAAQGYVVVATNYRGNSGGEGKEEFGGADANDVVNLIKSLPEIDQADPTRVALFGISRGGMMNYLTLKASKNSDLNIKCVINIGGITDLKETIEYHPEIDGVCQELVPNYATNQAAALRDRSAIAWVNEMPNTPLLLLHGTADKHVAYSQIPKFADKLDQNGIPYKLISFKGGSHGLIESRATVESLIADWLGKYLLNGATFDEAEKRIVI